VRGSSTTQVLQDLLVPSIESVTSDVAMPRLNEPLGVHDNINYSQEAYPRRVIEQRVHSPAPRPRAIINDGSPQNKRRRMIHEDDTGHFRPLPPRDFSLHSTHDSHLMSASSAHSGQLLVRHPRLPSQSTQGLSRDQPIFIDPDTAERLPVYDAPESDYFKSHPGYLRRMNDRPAGSLPTAGQISYPTRDDMSDGAYPRRPGLVQNGTENWEVVERDRLIPQLKSEYSQRSHVPRPFSPESSASRTLSHSYGPSFAIPDQDFVQSFSQSRLDGHASRAKNGFTIISERAPQSANYWNVPNHEVHSAGSGFTVLNERAPQSAVNQRNVQDHEDHPARSFRTLPLPRARSPVRYIERPM
jgi:hypothetical protein